MCESSFLKTDLKVKLVIIVMTDFIRSISHSDCELRMLTMYHWNNL